MQGRIAVELAIDVCGLKLRIELSRFACGWSTPYALMRMSGVCTPNVVVGG